ncbi:hypothetical protein [Photobacterium lutimaris]|nr:hypothetical protein [Photobacterium lutimaris]TDR69969.1 hypothetical protein DFP78_12523 [Photobacterium lutimaris]
MKYTKTILASVLTATFIGCGGGGGSPSGGDTSTATATKQGKVIDGYI